MSDTATYSDAMYELYVRMKIEKGLSDIDEGRVVPHEDVKKRFLS